MSKCQFNKAKYGTHQLILSWLGKNKLVLDVGCSSGYLGARTKENQFYGIELDKEKTKRLLEDGFRDFTLIRKTHLLILKLYVLIKQTRLAPILGLEKNTLDFEEQIKNRDLLSCNKIRTVLS